jgi:hypothetical protein
LLLNVIDVYQETWLKKPKSYKLSSYVADKSCLNVDQEACRFTASQELVLISSSQQMRYNNRKLNALPSLHSKLTTDLSIELTVRNILFNYDFMHKKLLTADLKTLVHQLGYILVDILLKNPKTIKIAKAMNVLVIVMFQSLSTLQTHPDNLALQFTSRLLKFYKNNDTFQRFINDCDLLSSHVCALLAPYQSMHSIESGHFLSQDNCSVPIECALYDAEYLVTCGSSLNVYDLGKFPIRIAFEIIPSNWRFERETHENR